jgi:hypothetical protein
VPVGDPQTIPFNPAAPNPKPPKFIPSLASKSAAELPNVAINVPTFKTPLEKADFRLSTILLTKAMRLSPDKPLINPSIIN